MDGIEKITGRIAEDVGREIDELTAEARRQADEIAARYDAQAKRECEDILARGRRNADERVERLAALHNLTALPLGLGLVAGGDLVGLLLGLALDGVYFPLGVF